MAEKRMFSKSITDRDDFLSMPPTTQNLYFHLGLHADDDGFVDSPRRIMTSVGAREDDMKILIAKQYIIPFESGVCVIKHWRIHNYLRSDRYKPTAYADEKSQLATLQSGEYTTSSSLGIPSVNQRYTDGMRRVVESSIEKSSRSSGGGFLSDSEAEDLLGIAKQLNAVLDAAKHAGFPDTQADYDKCNALVAEHGAEAMLKAIDTCADYPMEKRNWRYLKGILKSDPTGGGKERPKQEEPAFSMPRSFDG